MIPLNKYIYLLIYLTYCNISLEIPMIAFANLVLRARTFSQEHYDAAAKRALVDCILDFTREY
jgi:hypothetical protein